MAKNGHNYYGGQSPPFNPAGCSNLFDLRIHGFSDPWITDTMDHGFSDHGSMDHGPMDFQE